MSDAISPTTRTRVAIGLAALCQLLDDIPSMGLTQRPRLDRAPEDEALADELLLAAGPVTVFRRGGWASRFTTLPLLAVALDQRPATEWPTQPRVRRQLRVVGGESPPEAVTEPAQCSEACGPPPGRNRAGRRWATPATWGASHLRAGGVSGSAFGR